MIRPGATSVTEIEVARDGERRLVREDFEVCRGYAPSPADLDRILTADHVHIGWLDDGGALRRLLAGQGRSVSQDLSVNADPGDLGVEGLSIAFGSLPGLPGPAEALGRRWLAQGARMAGVTRGKDGSTVVSPTEAWHIPAEPVDPVDTTGAGDGFIAAFLVGSPGEGRATGRRARGRPLRPAMLPSRRRLPSGPAGVPASPRGAVRWPP